MDQERHAVVTGGTGSLGRAIAAALGACGWIVDAPASRQLDVRDIAAVTRQLTRRTVDLLVCAAGVTHDAPLLGMDETWWDEIWNVNYKGAVACAEAVLPSMLQRRQGHVVLISSRSALHPPAGQTAYAAAKAALLGYLADLAGRCGPSNVRANAILPGFLETRMTANVTARRRQQVLSQHVLGRFNTCEAVAAFVCFLHEQLPHTSGQVFQLDSRPAGGFPMPLES